MIAGVLLFALRTNDLLRMREKTRSVDITSQRLQNKVLDEAQGEFSLHNHTINHVTEVR